MKALLVVVLVLGACGDNNDKAPDAPEVQHDASFDAGPDKVARGRYIVNNLGVCTFCHTPLNPDGSRDMTRFLAGWGCDSTIPFFDADPTTAGFGCLSSRNLTNHATGLKNATDAAIKDAIKNGHRTDGKNLVPVMPYWVFHNMTDDDVDSIIAYLRTVTGVDHQVMANEPPWDDINNDNMAAPICTGAENGHCLGSPIDVNKIPLPVNPPDMAKAMNGRYLSSMVGLCIDCHTTDFPPPAPMAFPPIFPRPVNQDKVWAGGRAFPKEALGLVDASYPAVIFTRNLSSDATGLMGFSVQQISDAVAKGKDRDGKAVCAATHGNMISPYAGLDPSDLDDIANYIHSLPPIVNDTGENCVGPMVP